MKNENGIGQDLREYAMLRMRTDPAFVDDIYKGIDARIDMVMELNEDGDYGNVVYRWQGGSLAGVSDDLMKQFSATPHIGDTIKLPGLEIEIADYCPMGDFWFVTQVL